MGNNTPRRWALTAATLTLLASACASQTSTGTGTQPTKPTEPAEQLAYAETPDYCDTLIELGEASRYDAILPDNPSLTSEMVIASFTTRMLQSESLTPEQRRLLEDIAANESLEGDGSIAYTENVLSLLNELADSCHAEPTPLYTGTRISPAQDPGKALEFCQEINNDTWNIGPSSPYTNVPQLLETAMASLPPEYGPVLAQFHDIVLAEQRLQELDWHIPDDQQLNESTDPGDQAINRRLHYPTAYDSALLIIDPIAQYVVIADYCETINPIS